MEKQKLSRGASFAVIGAIYALAALVGILLYRILPGAPWLKLLLADVSATVFVFIFSCILKNASVYDPYWSVQPPVIVIAFMGKPSLTKILLVLMILSWGVRLTLNWAYTFKGMQTEDWRYRDLHDKTKGLYPIVNFIGIHLFPTLVVYLAVLPAVYVMLESPAFKVLAILGFLGSFGATLLQGISDLQMHSYRKERKTTFIENGLWKYSRHPNYLGEILMWWGVAIYAVSVLGIRWYLFPGAVAVTLLFLFISIPMADRRQGRKEGFEEYKARTRMLLPLPKHRKEDA